MRAIAFMACLALPVACALGEESAAFTLSSGITMTAVPACIEDSKQSIYIRKAKASYELSIRAFFSCDGSFSEPWLSIDTGAGATLVLGKEKNFLGLSSSCECLYELKVSIATERLDPKETLYVVGDQVVVGHVKVP